jgi:CheY-like chemotaxis protein
MTTEIRLPDGSVRILGICFALFAALILFPATADCHQARIFDPFVAAGFQVGVEADGGQAVETFGVWRPHFIWMDLRLPVFNGLEAARRIRELEGGREVKIVAVTASAFGWQREEVIAAGFNDFLRKPDRSSEIFDCMARHLGVRYVYGLMDPARIAHVVDQVSEQNVSLGRALRRLADELAYSPILSALKNSNSRFTAVGAWRS